MAEAARYFDRICDEMIDLEVLADSERPFIAALGRCLRRYRELLLATNAADFAHLQVLGGGRRGQKSQGEGELHRRQGQHQGSAHQ